MSAPSVVSQIAALICAQFPRDPHEVGLEIRSRFPDATPLEIARAGVAADRIIHAGRADAAEVGAAALLHSRQKRGLA